MIWSVGHWQFATMVYTMEHFHDVSDGIIVQVSTSLHPVNGRSCAAQAKDCAIYDEALSCNLYFFCTEEENADRREA